MMYIEYLYGIKDAQLTRLCLSRSEYDAKLLIKVEKILEGSLDLILSPSSSAKIQISGWESFLEV